MSSTTIRPVERGFSFAEYLTCLSGIVWREALRFLHQRERFISALVRPLVWLFIFAAGFRPVVGLSHIPPYGNYIQYVGSIESQLVAMVQVLYSLPGLLSPGPC